MSRRDVSEIGLERRLRAEAPAAGALSEDAVARVMGRVGRSEPGEGRVYPGRRGTRVGALVMLVAVGLGAWLTLGFWGGGEAAEAPAAARINEMRVDDVRAGAPAVEGALVEEAHRVLEDARRLREMLGDRVATLERAAVSQSRGG